MQLPEEFIVLKGFLIIVGSIGIVPTLPIACLLGGWDCGPSQKSNLDIIYIIQIAIYYFVSCIIVSVWNKFFIRFGEKRSLHEKRAVEIILLLFVLIAIILPAIVHFLRSL